jgi:hypothetical protein
VAGQLNLEGAWRNALDPAKPVITSLDCVALFADFPVAVLIA